jgi:hypothetical protein
MTFFTFLTRIKINIGRSVTKVGIIQCPLNTYIHRLHIILKFTSLELILRTCSCISMYSYIRSWRLHVKMAHIFTWCPPPPGPRIQPSGVDPPPCLPPQGDPILRCLPRGEMFASQPALSNSQSGKFSCRWRALPKVSNSCAVDLLYAWRNKKHLEI